MPFSTELVITPVEGVVRLEVADPVDHVEHSEAQGEESSGDLVNPDKQNLCSCWEEKQWKNTILGNKRKGEKKRNMKKKREK